MKLKLSSLIFFLLLLDSVYAVATVDFVGDRYLVFNFDKPKGSVDYFDITRKLEFSNPENTSVTVSSLNVTFSGVEGVTVSVDETSFTIPGESSHQVTVTFHASSSMAEKIYTGGKLTISGSGVTSKEIYPFTVEINHPNPTIRAIWDKDNWGSVKAGSSFKRILTVEEYYGYKNASNVSVYIAEVGPAEISYFGELGDFNPLDSKNIQINVTIPERGLRPGTYNIKPVIISSSIITSEPEEATYEIPVPKMEIENKNLDMGKITFEPGKDTTKRELTIKEVGGFTPIEGIRLSLSGGEAGWVSFYGDDYVPPGEAKNYTFSITLPPDASLGDKEWRFNLKTDYAGEDVIRLFVTVYFPGIEDAINYLNNISGSTDNPQENSLIHDTLMLLENAKGKTEIRKIAMVMSVYGGVRSLLSDLRDSTASRKEGEFNKAADFIIKASSALSKIRIGDQNLEDAELKLYSSKSVTSAEGLWTSAATEILRILEDRVEETRESNYKIAALHYKRMSRIASLMGENEKAVEYKKKQEELQQLYEQTLLAAADKEFQAQKLISSAKDKMFSLGEGEEAVFFVLNPFHYDSVSQNYASAIANYRNAVEMYKKAGEKRDADRVSEALENTLKQQKQIFTAFLTYGSILTVAFIWFMARVVLGLQRFREDDRDGKLGDVVIGKEVGS